MNRTGAYCTRLLPAIALCLSHMCMGATKPACPVAVSLGLVSAIVRFDDKLPSSIFAYDPALEQILLGTDSGNIEAWNARDGSPADTWLKVPTRIRHLAFQPGGKMLAVTTHSGDWFLVDSQTRKQHPRAPELLFQLGPLFIGFAASRTQFSPDGKLLLVFYEGEAYAVFDVTGDRPRPLHSQTTFLGFTQGRGAANAIFSPDSRYIAHLHSRGPARILDARTGATTGTLMPISQGHLNWTPSHAFSSDGKLYMTIRYNERTRPGQLMPSEGSFAEIYEMKWPGPEDEPTEHWTAGRRRQTFITLWAAAFIPSESVSPIPLFLPGSRVAIPGHDGTIRILNARTAREIKVLEVNTQDRNPVLVLALSPDGKTLASGSRDGEICTWDIERYSGQHCRLEGNKLPVLSLEFTEDGKYLVASAFDGEFPVFTVIHRETLRAQTVRPRN